MSGNDSNVSLKGQKPNFCTLSACETQPRMLRSFFGMDSRSMEQPDLWWLCCLSCRVDSLLSGYAFGHRWRPSLCRKDSVRTHLETVKVWHILWTTVRACVCTESFLQRPGRQRWLHKCRSHFQKQAEAGMTTIEISKAASNASQQNASQLLALNSKGDTGWDWAAGETQALANGKGSICLLVQRCRAHQEVYLQILGKLHLHSRERASASPCEPCSINCACGGCSNPMS